MTIYSEKAILLALSLCCFIHAVKYMVPSLISKFFMRNSIVTVPGHCFSSTLRPMPYISNALESWHFCSRHDLGKEH